MIIQAYTEEDRDMGMAKDIADALMEFYPNHLWAVTVKGGVAIIKAMNISSLYGMVLKLKDIQHDAGARRKAVMLSGGELLERANLFRGGYKSGDRVNRLDGVENYQPIGVR
jgi:hypothetical protein